MSDAILYVTDGEFEKTVLKAAHPTLVDFWAEWCAPCRALAPVLEDVAGELKGKLQIAKMNVDEHPNTPGKYSIRSIPTLLLFKDGKVVDQLVGLVSKAKLLEMVNRHL